MARRLTKQRIDDLVPVPGRQFTAWDTAVRGFGVRVSGSGAKTYVLKFRTKAGRVRWKSYGRTDGDVSLEKARSMAEEDRGTVAAGGDH